MAILRRSLSFPTLSVLTPLRGDNMKESYHFTQFSDVSREVGLPGDREKRLNCTLPSYVKFIGKIADTTGRR
jgi:hypothetical protein